MSVFRSLQHRDFRLFLAGQMVSLIGTWMESVAQAWLIYRLTGSAVLLGWVTFAGQAPILLLSPIGGSFADVHDRRKILISAQLVSMATAVLLAILTLSATVEPWHILALAVVLGITNSFDIPARQAIMPELVPREDLTNAIALNSSMFSGARTIGPAFGGLAVAAIGEGWCFAINAVSYLAAVAGLLAMRGTAAVPAKPRNRGHMAEGFRFIARTRPVRALVLLVGASSLLGMPHATLMPVFAKEILGGDAAVYGMLLAASGIGSVAGGLLLARRKGFDGLGRWIATGSAAFGLSLTGFAFSRSAALSAALVFLAGLSALVQLASSNTLVQAMVPGELRGRVMAVYSMTFLGMFAVGGLTGSWLAQFAGAPAVVAAGGVAVAIAAGVFSVRMSSMRAEARELLAAQQLVSEPRR